MCPSKGSVREMSTSRSEADSSRRQDDGDDRVESLERTVANLAEQLGAMLDVVSRLATEREEYRSAGGCAAGSAGDDAAGDAGGSVAAEGGEGAARDVNGRASLREPAGQSESRSAGGVTAGPGQVVGQPGSGSATGFAPPGTTPAGGWGVSGPGFGPGAFGSESFQNYGGFMGQQTLRISAPVFQGKGHSFAHFKRDFIQAAKALCLDEHFVSDQLSIPVADPTKTRADLLREGYSARAVGLGFQAWNFLSAALPNAPERAVLRRCTSPKQAFEELEAVSSPTTEGARQVLLQEFLSFSISINDDPILRLHEIEELGARMCELHMVTADTTLAHTRFINALPLEYELAKLMLLSAKELTRDGIIRIVHAQFHQIHWKEASKNPRGAEQALPTGGNGAGDGNGSGARRARRDRGRGGGNRREEAQEDGAGDGGAASGRGCENNGGGFAAGSGNGGARRGVRCFRCGRGGHPASRCATKERDFLPLCERCGGGGHTEEECPSPEGV